MVWIEAAFLSHVANDCLPGAPHDQESLRTGDFKRIYLEASDD